MNSNIQVFKNAELGSVHTMVGAKGEPLFRAIDVCKALGYANSRTALVTHVDKDDVLKQDGVDSKGRKNRSSYINESGLYALIFSSKLPKAQDFKRWVTNEVLPQIRKTGGYIPVGNDDDKETLLTKALAIEELTIAQKDDLIVQKDEQLEQKDEQLKEKSLIILAQQPAVQFAAAVAASDDSILIRDLAKLITQNGVKIGQTRMFNWLRQNGYLFQHETRPMQSWVERGIFAINEKLMHLYGSTKFRLTTKVTGKGQRYFINGFLSGKFKA